jgi:hypothetical protein
LVDALGLSRSPKERTAVYFGRDVTAAAKFPVNFASSARYWLLAGKFLFEANRDIQ